MHTISHVCDQTCHCNNYLPFLDLSTFRGSEKQNAFENNISSHLNIIYSGACRTVCFEQNAILTERQ